MESSYRIIKNNHIENSTDDRHVINTEIENIIEETLIGEELLEFDIDNEEKLEIINNLEEYKKRINMQIEFERKNILERALIDAEKQAMDIRQAAHEEGYNEGYARAIEDAKAEAKEIKNSSLDLLEDVKECRDNFLRENKANIYDLAKTMAENIIHHCIDVNDEKIVNLMEPLLEEYLKEEDITITSNKEGKEKLEKHRERLERICPNTRFIFLLDSSIEKNGFIIENKESIVDLGIGLQLENMVRAISDMDE